MRRPAGDQRPSQHHSRLTMAEPIQPTLPSLPAPVSADAGLFAAPQHGMASAEALAREQPDRYAMVLEMRGRGMGQLSISRELSMGIHTVRAVLQREGRALFAPETDNPNAIRLMREGRELALERTIEALQDDSRARKMTPDRLAVTVGILTQNAELLSGNPTGRIEHVHDAPPAADEFAAFLRQGAIDAEVIETGIEAGDGAPKRPRLAIGPGDGPADPDGDAAAAPVPVAPTDPAGTPGAALHKMNDQVEAHQKANESACCGAGDVTCDVTAGGRGADPDALADAPGGAAGAGVDAAGAGAPGGEGVAFRRPASESV